MSDQEKNDSEKGIYRYENYQPKDFEGVFGNEENIEAISNHIEANIGEIKNVFHEILSHLVHIDIHYVEATEARPYHAYVTSGMSDKPMKVAEGSDVNPYIELCILLPELWETDLQNFQNNNNWPLHWLKYLAKFPHEFDGFFDWGHTIPNGEEPEPFVQNTKLCCWMISPPVGLPEEFFELKISEEKTICFYCIVPIYKEEMNFKLKEDSHALMSKLGKNNISAIMDLNRINTCKKKGLLDLW